MKDIEDERKYRLDRSVQVEALKALVKTPEWKVFAGMVELEELELWERKTLDPTALVTGVSMVSTAVPNELGQKTVQEMPSPTEGMSFSMKMIFSMGVAWGVRNTLSFPARVQKVYEKYLESRMRETQLASLASGKTPISGIDKNPVEGGR